VRRRAAPAGPGAPHSPSGLGEWARKTVRYLPVSFFTAAMVWATWSSGFMAV
jgi:hypothetical protein